MDNRDMSADNFFFDVTVDSLGRLVPDVMMPSGVWMMIASSTEAAINSSLVIAALCAPAFSQIRDRYYRPDNLFAEQSRARDRTRPVLGSHRGDTGFRSSRDRPAEPS